MRVQRDDVRQTRQPTCFQFSGELRHDVEAAALRGTVESAGERGPDLVVAGSREAPRLPNAGRSRLTGMRNNSTVQKS